MSYIELTMKKILIFLLGVLCIDYSYAQEEVVKQKKSPEQRKIQIGINFSPDLCYRTLKADGSQIGTSFVERRNNMEVIKSGSTFGGNISYSISRNISFETGLHFSNRGYKTKKIVSDPLLTIGSTPSTVVSKIVVNYLDIPIKINIMFGKGKLRLISSTGLLVNLLVGSKVKNIEEAEGEITKSSFSLSKFDAFNLSPIVSVGLYYRISDRINVRIEPSFQCQFLENKDYYTTEYLWSSGLNFGLFYKI